MALCIEKRWWNGAYLGNKKKVRPDHFSYQENWWDAEIPENSCEGKFTLEMGLMENSFNIMKGIPSGHCTFQIRKVYIKWMEITLADDGSPTSIYEKSSSLRSNYSITSLMKYHQSDGKFQYNLWMWLATMM